MSPSAKWLARHLGRRPDHREGPLKLIVGLGNPGIEYASSRHNAGFMVLDRLAEQHGLSFSRRRFNATLAEGLIEGQRVVLAKPQTFMNASGQAVGKLVSFFHIHTHDIIIVYDDLDLPFGRLRMRAQGSAGGHHGMESIISALGTSDFARLRIGIGRPETREDIDHVLGRFTREEESELATVLDHAAQAVDVWLTEGVEKSMNQFNSL